MEEVLIRGRGRFMEGATKALAIATFILAGIAALNILNTNRITKGQNRPYVVVGGVRQPAGYRAFVISNTGKTAARDISVKIIQSSQDEQEVYLDVHILYLPPGRKELFQAREIGHDHICKATVSYKPDWMRWQYKHEFSISLQTIFRRELGN